MKPILIALLTLLTLFSFDSNGTNGKQAQLKKSILITGTSTGIGRNLAETLAKNGHHVYAGVRNNEDYAELNAIDNITALKFDVTVQSQIDAARKFVEEQGTGLYAIVNNAGIGNFGTVINSDIADHKATYAVNVEGVYRVTKAFAPMVIEAKGRISTTGSIAGTITNSGMTAYSGSKHWIEAYTDGLAIEMKEHGVHVSVIQPGNYQSHIRRSSVLRTFEKIKANGGTITPELEETLKQTTARELSYKQPDDVSAAYMHALFDEKPLRRYVVTPNQQEQAFTISTKVRQLVELNQWGPHHYTRDQLVEMLDKAIKASSN